MEAKKLKEIYLEFFREKNHKIIHSASLIPENDSSVLFTTAGMHPLVPFLIGQPHPLGNRLANFQKCVRTGDIDEVGDKTHHTFFEMLGNWSLGDYFKRESINWSFEFLTSKNWLNIPINRLAFTCFLGNNNSSKDEESAVVWESLGVSKDRIQFLDDNWWETGGDSGPCGPDTEIFYWSDNSAPAPTVFDPSDIRWVEIWNNVFIQYNKVQNGVYELLDRKNVDTGLGVERVTAVLQGLDDNYMTERFKPIINLLEEMSGKKYEEYKKEMRIVADHLRASVFMLGDEREIIPCNVDQGYILRRLIRRSIRILYKLEINDGMALIVEKIVNMYSQEYPELLEKLDKIKNEILLEEKKFKKTLQNGLKELDKNINNQIRGLFYREYNSKPKNDEELKKFQEEKIKEIELKGSQLFYLFQSHGFPIEMVFEEVEDTYKLKIAQKEKAIKEFNLEYEKHQELSRKGAEQKFKGGLSETSDITKKYHTATHILGQAIREVLKDSNIVQKGSNITPQRLRYDFNFDRKLTDEEITEIEKKVNDVIKKSFIIKKEEMSLKDALSSGAQSEFGTKYPDKVWVYSIDNYSKEICMGPHVDNTIDLGIFKIIKEESSAAGIRRIKAKLL